MALGRILVLSIPHQLPDSSTGGGANLKLGQHLVLEEDTVMQRVADDAARDGYTDQRDKQTLL